MAGEDKIKDDEGKLPWDLLPIKATQGLLEVLAYGRVKYGPESWRQGIAYSRLFSASMRHLWAWWGGQDIDPESGQSHLDKAAANIAFLSEYVKEGRKHLDDRSSLNTLITVPREKTKPLGSKVRRMPDTAPPDLW